MEYSQSTGFMSVFNYLDKTKADVTKLGLILLSHDLCGLFVSAKQWCSAIVLIFERFTYSYGITGYSPK